MRTDRVKFHNVFHKYASFFVIYGGLATVAMLALIMLDAAEVRGQSGEGEAETYLIDDFEDEEVGELPAGWYNRDGSSKLRSMSARSRQTYLYRIQREAGGNHYLHYEGTGAKHINYPLVNKQDVNIHETPILSWRWRVHDLPEGANERSSDRNDAAASIYVVFEMANYVVKKLPVSIRYTWSTSLPVGTNASKLLNKQQIEVVESGSDELGQWITVERNLLKDYKRLHGGTPPKKPIALLILSDGDSVGDSASADYDDIKLMPEAGSRKAEGDAGE